MNTDHDFEADTNTENENTTPLERGGELIQLQRVSTRRPSDRDLLEALMAYRAAPADAVQRAKLAMVLECACQFAAAGRAAMTPTLAAYRDELVQMTWMRLLGQENRNGQLLAEYDPAHDADAKKVRSVYSWVWQNCNFAARDQLIALKHKFPSSPQWEMSLTEFDPSEQSLEEGEKMQLTPKHLQILETPLKASHLRVTTLTPWLVTLAREMVGQKLTLSLPNGDTKNVKFDHSHQDIWLKWLALKPADCSDDTGGANTSTNYSDLELNELSEADLAETTGLSKATIQRHTNEAYAFMLQHPEFPKYLELMIPNRVRGNDVADEDLYTLLAACLQDADGKVHFRELVHCWVKTNYGQEG